VLDCPQPANEVLAFYRERLTAAGWTVPELPHPRQGGFQHGPFANQATYCHGTRGPALSVQADPVPNRPTDVRLNLQTDARYSPCSRQNRVAPSGRQSVIPDLAPPPGSRQMGGGSGGSSASWHSDATLHTDLDLPTLATHYASQLEHAGWTSTGAGHDGPLTWSTWTFHDEDAEPWHGLFFALRHMGAERDCFLSMHVDADTDGGMQGGQQVRLLGSSGGSFIRP